jgi:ATP-dependent protease ClpP protease subunit
MQKISIFGPIDQRMADEVRRQIETLDRTLPLTVEINSDGGSVQAGVAIYSAILGWPGGVTTEVAGWALSIASLVLMAGDKRRCHGTSLAMVHSPWCDASGNSQALRERADLLDRVAQTLKSGYRRTGQPEAVIEGWLSGPDHWFTADEALAAGLVTEVVEADQDETPNEFANAMACAHRVPAHLEKRIMMTTHTVPTRATIEAAAVQAEARRRAEIRASAAPIINRQGMREFVESLENDPSVSSAEAGRRILARLGEGTFPIAGAYVVASHSDDRVAEFKAAACDALLQRSGARVAQPHPAARDLARTSLVAMAESVLSMTGRTPRDRSPSGMIQAAMATDDFPALLAATAGKALAMGYEQAPNTHTGWTGERDVSDFKPQTLVNVSEAPALLEVPELAEYKNGNLTDSATTFQLVTSGRILEISRQAMINDDLGALAAIPLAMGVAARRLEADKVFGILNDNPDVRDGKALFHADHGNLGAAGVLSIESLGAARAAMRRQKGIAGLGYIDPQPEFLIVPVALQTKAEQLVASVVDPAAGNATPNMEFIRRLKVVADPRLDEGSEIAWYLAAAPSQIDGILRVYLAGQRGPVIEEHVEYRRDVAAFKVRLDFGAGIIDHRALFKNPGA